MSCFKYTPDYVLASRAAFIHECEQHESDATIISTLLSLVSQTALQQMNF